MHTKKIPAPNSLQIYILSRNRKNYLKEAVLSCLSVRGENIEIIVSENSTDEDVHSMLAQEFPSVRVIRRVPALDVFKHTRAVIQESDSEFLMIFHDDDILLSDYVDLARTKLINNPEISAVGCNAYFIENDKKTKILHSDLRSEYLIKNSTELAIAYLKYQINLTVPFSGYMYRNSRIRNLFLDPANGGKHSDVSFLMQVVNTGPLIWLPDPLMYYRLHTFNGSRNEDVAHRLSLLRFMKKVTELNRDSQFFDEYKFQYLLRYLIQCQHFGWRERVFLRFVWRLFFKVIFRNREFWRKLHRRLIRLIIFRAL